MFFTKKSQINTNNNQQGYLSSIYKRVHNIKMTLGEYTGINKSEQTPYTGIRFDYYDPYQKEQTMDLDVEEYLLELDEDYDEVEHIQSRTTTNMDLKHNMEVAEAIIKELARKKRESVRELIARRTALSYHCY